MQSVSFAGNDYLGLAQDPRPAEAMCRAAREYGVGATSGRSFLGWSSLHRRLEADLVEFLGTEDVCLLPSTYLGGLIYYKRMAEWFDAVLCDETVHQNQFDGMRAAGLEIHTFQHLDAGDVRRQLAAWRGPKPPIVATDSIYGISGELAPLREIADAAREAGAELFIDDAHGVFALGASGRGAWELCGIEPNEATVLGSMSKALGVIGGFLAGRREIVGACQTGPFSVGATPLPPPVIAACIEALRLARTEPERRERMEANAARMRGILARHGIRVVSDRTPIVTMVLRDEFEAAELARQFEANGLVIRYAKYPSEPRHNLLRTAARATHTDQDLERFEQVVRALRRG